MSYIKVNYRLKEQNGQQSLQIFTPTLKTELTENFSEILALLQHTGGNIAMEQFEMIFQDIEGVRLSNLLDALSPHGIGYCKATRMFTGADTSTLTGQVVDYIFDRYVENLSVKLDDETVNKIVNLINFGFKLSKNNSNKIYTRLLDFLLHNSVTIRDDGYFECYKVVRADYTDCHTGTYDNSIGTTVEMPRQMVDDVDERTCSHGLHVCTAAYIPFFSGGDSRVVKVRVDPSDVVSIPTDYNSAKMRVCKYLVLSDVTDEFTEEEEYDD